MLVRVEGAERIDRNTLAGLHRRGVQSHRDFAVPGSAQNNQRATEDGSASTRTERIRSIALDRQKIRSEEHVRQELGVRSAHQQHQ